MPQKNEENNSSSLFPKTAIRIMVMKLTSNKQTQTSLAQSAMDKCRRLLEESIFLRNSFFLTGQNIPTNNAKDQTRIEKENAPSNVEILLNK